MKFVITRTSMYGDEERPCEEAVRVSGFSTDERTCAHPDDNQYIGSVDWYSRGVNHRVENGHIKRDFPAKAWVIEIADLPSLIAFYEKHGKIVIGPETNLFRGLPRIEIYDDYRE